MTEEAAVIHSAEFPIIPCIQHSFDFNGPQAGGISYCQAAHPRNDAGQNVYMAKPPGHQPALTGKLKNPFRDPAGVHQFSGQEKKGNG